MTTRGFGKGELETVGRWIVEVLGGLARGPDDNSTTETCVHKRVRELCSRFPIHTKLGAGYARES